MREDDVSSIRDKACKRLQGAGRQCVHATIHGNLSSRGTRALLVKVLQLQHLRLTGALRRFHVISVIQAH